MIDGGNDQAGTGDVGLLLAAREREAATLHERLKDPRLDAETRKQDEVRLRYLEEGVIPSLRHGIV